MHSLLSICINEKTSFTKMVLLNRSNARTDHDVWLNKLRHKKSDDVTLNIKQRHLNGILYKMQFCCKIENLAQIWSNLFLLS